MKSRHLSLVAFSVGLLVACDGELSLNNTHQAPGSQIPDSTKPGDPVTLDPQEVELTAPHVRRLTPLQFENTVRAALGDVVTPENLPRFGDDIPTIGLNNNPSILRINTINVDSVYSATSALARAAVTGVPLVQQCVQATGDACFEAVVDTLGPKLWRRALRAEEKEDLLTTRALLDGVGSRAEQAEFLIHAMLASPNTLFRYELGQPADGHRVLSQFELASALSYTLWNSPPDKILYDAAVAGELSSAEAILAQTRRMMEDPRSAEAMAAFFVDYLKVETILSKPKEESLGLTDEARASLLEGIRRDLRDTFSAPDATLLDPFSTTQFHVDRNGASFFGVPVVQENAFEVISMNPGERLGVLSHPAFLSVHSGQGDSGIIKRGVFTLEQLLCVHVGSPPADISPTDDVPEGFNDATETSREVLSVRHSSQAGCVACHRIIDPAGFGFEHYDSAGRYRVVEKQNVQIDASGELKLGDEILSFQNSVGYIDALTKSEALRSCLSDTFFTYVIGNSPKLAERERLYQVFDASNGDVESVIEALVTTPSFSSRHAEAP